MKLVIPELSVVVLIGASGSGKSSFARRYFRPTQVLSSDFFRGLVSDDENDQASTGAAFETLHYVLRKRLVAGKLTVIDATNVQPEARKPLVEIAREYHMLPVAIVLNTPERICLERNVSRPDRDFGPHVVRNQSQSLRRSLRGLEREGFRHVFVLKPDETEHVSIEFQPLWNNKRAESGPFDIIGDVHGCFEELCALLGRLGYTVDRESYTASAPTGRKAVFVGDLVDRGPDVPGVLKLVMSMEASGIAFCVPGNHDVKLLRKLKGRDVRITHGLAESLAQLDNETPEFRKRVAGFIDDMVSHYVFDDGKLVVAHAGMKESMQGRGSGKVRDFALYGETTGETDDYGLPVRYNWAADYRGRAYVVYGHTPVAEPEFLNRTINIDTGCVFGGKLTALRYPEMELVAVPAARTYYEPSKPFLAESPTPVLSQQQSQDDLLEIEDVIGKRHVTTRFREKVTIREENAIAALEVMSRFAANPKWLVYLPPTMSPCETSRVPDLLEHPAEAFAYFLHEGVPQVICQEKHMGSRAVIVACRSQEVAQRRFGVVGEGAGACLTRTGRRFFQDAALEREFVKAVRDSLEASGLWDRLATDWVVLDCELMPWSAKAQELLVRQYAPVASAAKAGLEESIAVLASAARSNPEVERLLQYYRERLAAAERYQQAYGRYCWEVKSLADLKLAPFHIMATEGKVHADKRHDWHMEHIQQLCASANGLLLATRHIVVDLTDPHSVARGVEWWNELTSQGGEGMVVKPMEFVAKGRKGIVQPAVKCRGREYLRIIYGPEYTLPENLPRLKARGLAGKRSLALREFALGLEALERFVAKEPLRRVHECVFGVLALESEPVDPRL